VLLPSCIPKKKKELGADKLPIKVILSAASGEVSDLRMMILFLLGYNGTFFFREKTRQ